MKTLSKIFFLIILPSILFGQFQRGKISQQSVSPARINTVNAPDSLWFESNPLINESMSSPSFISGWTGSGYRLSKDTNGINLELDNLTVRKRMEIYELLIRQIRATNGAVFVTAAAQVDSVKYIMIGVDSVRFVDPTGNDLCPFASNDLIMCQVVNMNNSSVIRLVQATVTGVKGRTIRVSYNSGTFQKGDEVVRIGNTTDVTRQSSIYMTSDDNNAPYMDMITGVNSWSAWSGASKTKLRIGNLSGITDPSFGALSGYGLYAANVYLTGAFNLNSSSNISNVPAFQSIVSARVSDSTNFANGLKDTVQLRSAITQNANSITSEVTARRGDSLSFGTAIFQNAKAVTIFKTLNGTTDSTTISGNIVSTGTIQSNNYNTTQGSQFNLDKGTINIGGSTSPRFSVDSAGNATMNNAKFNGVITTDLLPDTNDIRALGSDSKNWKSLWVSSVNSTVFAKHTVSGVGGWMRVCKNVGNLGSQGSVYAGIFSGVGYQLNDVITVASGDGTCRLKLLSIVSQFGSIKAYSTQVISSGYGYVGNYGNGQATGNPYNTTGGSGSGGYVYVAISDFASSTDNVMNFKQLMNLNDLVEFRTQLANGSVAFEYVRVGSAHLINAVDTFYTVTRGIAGSSPVMWGAGTCWFDLGKSGDGFVDIAAVDVPRISIYSVNDSSGSTSEILRLGRLNGMYGGLNGNGIYVGTSSGNHLIYLNGILTIAGEGSGVTNINGGNLQTGTVTADRLNVSSLSALSANMGTLTSGSVVIGSTNKIWLNDSNDGGLSIGGSTKSSAPFQVTSDGVLSATGGTFIRGTVKDTLTVGSSSVSGVIKSYDYSSGSTGWKIGTGTLELNGAVFNNASGSFKGSILIDTVGGSVNDVRWLSIGSGGSGYYNFVLVTLTVTTGSGDLQISCATNNYGQVASIVSIVHNGTSGYAISNGNATYCEHGSGATINILNVTNAMASKSWVLSKDYLIGNQTITLGGILSGSGTTSITASAASGYYMPTITDQTKWNSAATHKTTEDALNGLVKVDGSGNYSAITDNHSNWDNGYTYRLTSASGTSPLTLTLSGNALTGSIANAAADGSTKGAATFNATNFTASIGIVNTIQNINTGASPTFVNETLTALTNGYLAYKTSSGWANSGFYWDGTHGGIGTTNPTSLLDIGATYSATADFKIFNTNPTIILQRGTATGSTDWQMQNNGGDLQFSSGYDGTTNSAFRSATLTMLSTGNVGIGTTNPTIGLQVEKDNGNGWATLFRRNASSNGILFGTPGGVSTIAAIDSTLGVYQTLALNPNGGNVGIGTTSPTSLLDIGATYSATADFKIFNTNPTIILQRGTATGSTDWQMQNNGGDLQFSSGYDGTTNSAFRSATLTMLSTGNVGIGTTNPTIGLQVEKDNGNGWATLFRRNASSNGILFGTPGGVSTIAAIDSTLGVYQTLALNPNGGNVGIGTTSPTSLLDIGATYSATADFKIFNTNPTIILQRGTATGSTDWQMQNNGGDLQFSSGYDGTTNSAFRSATLTMLSTGNVGIGYSTGTEITNNKLAVNGNGFFNGTLTLPNSNVLTGESSDVSFSQGIKINDSYFITPQTYSTSDPFTGYSIGQAGSIFRKLTVNELHSKSSITDQEQTLLGSQIISKSVAKLSQDFTVGSGNLVVDEIEGYTGQVFANGDYIRLRSFSRGAFSLTVTDAWGTVAYISRDATAKTQQYSFTLASGTSQIYSKGSLALDYGISGNGILERVAISAVGNKPYDRIATWTNAPYTDLTTINQVGDLSGLSTTNFGTIASGVFGTYTNRLYAETNVQIAGNLWALTGGIGGTYASPVVTLANYGMKINNAGTAHSLGASEIAIGNITGVANSAIKLTNTGTNSTSGLFGYTSSGAESFALQLDGTDRLAGWNFNSTTISSGGISLVSSATPSSNKIYIGTGTYSNNNTAFYVDGSGLFSLKDKLTWDGTTLSIIGNGTFSGALSGGTILIGSNDNVFKADSNGIYLGNASFASAPFSVSMAGALIANNATISGSITVTGGNAATQSYVTGLGYQTASNVTTIIGNTVTTGYVNALNITANSVVANVSLSSPSITGGIIQTSSTTGLHIAIEGGNDRIAFYRNAASVVGAITPLNYGIQIISGADGIYFSTYNTGIFECNMNTQFDGSVSIAGNITNATYHGTAITDTYISSATNWNSAYSNRITGMSLTNISGNLSSNTLTLSIPQSVATTATPTFAGGTFNGQITINPTSDHGLIVTNRPSNPSYYSAIEFNTNGTLSNSNPNFLIGQTPNSNTLNIQSFGNSGWNNIFSMDYLGNTSFAGNLYQITKIASNNIRNYHDAETLSASTSYVKLKTITLNNAINGSIRVFCDLKGSAPTNPVYYKIYVNGSAVGSEHSLSSMTYTTYSDDLSSISYSAGTTVEVWAKAYSGLTTYVKNFRLAYDENNIAASTTNN